MILVDTSIWIEFFKKHSPYFEHLLFLLEQGEVLTTEAVFAELFQGARDDHERHILEQYWTNLPHFSGKNLWIEAGMEAGKKRWPKKGLSLVDSLLLWISQEKNAPLWTLDQTLLTQTARAYTPHLS